MASFYGHFGTSVVLAGAYGAAGSWFGNFDWGVVILASGLDSGAWESLWNRRCAS
jgi:hypothetical protein